MSAAGPGRHGVALPRHPCGTRHLRHDDDLFFSGHTAIAVYGAATLAGHGGSWGLFLGLAIAFFEAITVLILRAHYTMDVFTGIICALWVYSIDGTVAVWVDGVIRHWAG